MEDEINDENKYNEEGKVSGWKYWDMGDSSDASVEKSSLKTIKSENGYNKISINDYDYDAENEVRDIDPWWEKIISNRH